MLVGGKFPIKLVFAADNTFVFIHTFVQYNIICLVPVNHSIKHTRKIKLTVTVENAISRVTKIFFKTSISVYKFLSARFRAVLDSAKYYTLPYNQQSRVMFKIAWRDWQSRKDAKRVHSLDMLNCSLYLTHNLHLYVFIVFLR